MSGPLIIETHSAAETESLGRTLASMLPNGTLVALHGDLASGKTCLVRGMASHFHREGNVHSPTFTLINEYGDDPKLYHIDLYRLNSPAEVADLGLIDMFEGKNIVVIEWAERAEGLLPKQRLDVYLEHAGGDKRRLEFRDHGAMPEGWQLRLG